MELARLLTAIGLSKHEVAIYMDLLTYGTQTISSISRTCKLHRPAIYRALPHLKEKGLVSERRIGKLIYYAAEPPERLRSLLEVVHQELNTVIPELTQLQQGKAPIVRRLDGKVGIHAVFEDILSTLQKGDEFYRYSSEGKEEMLNVGVPKDYVKRRDAMRLERVVITNPEFVASREPSLEETLKIVPKEFLPFDYGVSQIVYGNKIAFIDYRGQMATIIENSTLAKFQRDIFKMLYRRI